MDKSVQPSVYMYKGGKNVQCFLDYKTHVIINCSHNIYSNLAKQKQKKNALTVCKLAHGLHTGCIAVQATLFRRE